MIESAIQDEELMDSVVVAMLSSDPLLREIPPARAIEDDGFVRNQELSLDVRSTLTGKSIGIVSDYSVTVRLQRQVRGANNQADFRGLWSRVLSVLQSPPASLPIYASLSQLTFSDIEANADSEASDEDYSRSVTFTAFMAKL